MSKHVSNLKYFDRKRKLFWGPRQELNLGLLPKNDENNTQVSNFIYPN